MVPAIAHFVWIGRSLPWTHVLAVRSAARSGGFERILFHHTDDLSGSANFRELSARDGVEARRLEPRAFLSRFDRGHALAALYDRLRRPAARSNLLRVALLREIGGVYLDLDTITIRSLTPLRETSSFFCGEERLVFPARLRPAKHPAGYAAALVRTALRDVLRRLPDGWRTFRRIEHRYPTALNNAVVGAAAEHPLLDRLLGEMLALTPRRQRVRYALGTALFQQVVPPFDAGRRLLLPPETFYPLGPEISQHWFRLREGAALGDVLPHTTRAVHWYASVRTEDIVGRIDAEYVRRHAERQWFSQLALPYVD